MPDSNGLKNINGTIYKSLVSQDMYLSDDLLTAVYASGGKINIVPTSSTITVPDTPKITTILLDVTDDGSSLSLDQSKLDVAVNPNFEPILRKNEVDRITI